MVFFRFKNKKTANEIVLVAGFSLSILIERRSFLLNRNTDFNKVISMNNI